MDLDALYATLCAEYREQPRTAGDFGLILVHEGKVYGDPRSAEALGLPAPEPNFPENLL